MERPPAPPGSLGPSRRGENVPPPPGQSSHRPSRSQEEALKARRAQGGPRGPGPANSPQRRAPPGRRPRRNSESSVLDFDARPLTEEEKKMIEAKRREGERQRREAREKSKAGRPSRRMDIIDQLDATSIYGTGRMLMAVLALSLISTNH